MPPSGRRHGAAHAPCAPLAPLLPPSWPDLPWYRLQGLPGQGARSVEGLLSAAAAGWGRGAKAVVTQAAASAPAAAGEAAGEEGVVCIEFTKGKRRVYRSSRAHRGAQQAQQATEPGFSITDDAVTHSTRARDLVSDYLLPQGYPHSVAPQYSTYMAWRGVQYFFGGEGQAAAARAGPAGGGR